VVDLYTTIAGLYGISGEALRHTGPMAPDGVDFWPSITGTTHALARNETVINVWTLEDGTLTGALVQGDYRLYMGYPGHPDTWSLPTDENSTEPTPPSPKGVFVAGGIRRIPCGDDNLDASIAGTTGSEESSATVPKVCDAKPCLFNTRLDPQERHDIAGENPAIVSAMVARMRELQKSEVSMKDSDLCPSPPPGMASWPSSYDSTYQSGFWQPWCDGV